MSQSFSFSPEANTKDFVHNDTNTNTTLSITALARYEIQAGKGNDGTKILMVEWEDDDRTRSCCPAGGSWHVSWEGKQAVLPADEQTSDSSTRRFYFLLPPNVTIPPVVQLRYEPPPNSNSNSNSNSGDNQKPAHALTLNPLPAIFPPQLGATGRSAGKRGVLHTIWAKKRLQVLDREIRDECLSNAEGIALHMALQEKEWIETNFGVSSRPEHHSTGFYYPTGPATPVSPSSNSGGKLGEKLKGLKLQTSERELSEGACPARSENNHHLLSPQSPDVAVSSFNSFHAIHQQPFEPVKVVAQYPSESLQTQQSASGSGFASIARTSSADSSGEELFAKALSPRSPDLPRSPFSFAPETLVTAKRG